jgi:hypothetical protein
MTNPFLTIPVNSGLPTLLVDTSQQITQVVNLDPVNTVYVGYGQGIIAGDILHTIPLSAGSTFTVVPGSPPLYGVTPSGETVSVAVLPGGTNFTVPPSLSNLGGAKVFVQATTPSGIIPLNSLWFDTANGSLQIWNGSAWTIQQLSGQELIQAATIFAAQIANQTITPAQIDYLDSSVIGNTGSVLNANPYLTGGSITGWAAAGIDATVTVTASPPAGAPYEYALDYVQTNNVNGERLYDINERFSVLPNTQYQASAWVYTPTTTVFIGFDWRSSTGSLLGTSYETFTVTADTWTLLTTVQESIGTAASANIAIGSATASTTIYAQAGLAQSQIPGTLIQAASLTTAQIAAAAGILGSQIAAATITSSNIAANTIVAANIAANTITAAQLAAGIIYAGIVNGTNIVGSNLYLYNGSPAAGNLLLAVVDAAGFDGEGNAVLPGWCVYNYSGSEGPVALQFFSLSDTVHEPAFQVYTATSYAGPWTLQNGMYFTLGGGAVFQEDAVFDAAVNIGTFLEIAGSSAPAAGSGVIVYVPANAANINALLPSGFVGNIPLMYSDVTQITVTAATLTQLSSTGIPSIEANDAVAGTKYHLRCGGFGKMGTTAETMEFAASAGGVNTGTGQIYSASLLTASQTFSWEAEAWLTVLTTGASGTAALRLRSQIGGSGSGITTASGSVQQTASPGTIAFNTTVANAFFIEFAFGSASVGCTITCTDTILERS